MVVTDDDDARFVHFHQLPINRSRGTVDLPGLGADRDIRRRPESVPAELNLDVFSDPLGDIGGGGLLIGAIASRERKE